MADESGGALVDEGLEVDVVDGRERGVEEVAGERPDGDEVSVEEDSVKYCFGGSLAMEIFFGSGCSVGKGERGAFCFIYL